MSWQVDASTRFKSWRLSGASFQSIFLLVLANCMLAWLASLVYLFFGVNEVTPDVYPWVREVYFLGKRPQMLFFLASVPFLFLLIAGWQIFFADRLKSRAQEVGIVCVVEFLTAGAVLLLGGYLITKRISHSSNFVGAATLLVLQAISVCVLIGVYFKVFRQGLSLLNGGTGIFESKWPAFLVMIGCFLFQVFVYAPLATNNLPYANEYLNVPSQILGHPNAATDSIEALNSIRQLGLKIQNLERPIAKVNRPFLPVAPDRATFASEFSRANPEYFYYDFFLRGLVAAKRLTFADAPQLVKVTGASEAAVKGFIEQTDRREDEKLAIMAPDETNLLDTLKFNVHWQTLSRWYFHHHNFVWGAALKLGEGISLKRIFFQYGLAGGAVQYWLTQKITGGFGIPGYFLVWSLLFAVYFIAFLYCVYLITKSLFLTANSALLVVAFLASQQYEFIFLGPGLNPIRHFFDVVAFALFWFFIKKGTRALFCALMLSITLNFILNPEFGMFCSSAILYGVALFVWSRKRLDWFYVLAIGGVVVSHVLCWVLLKTGQEVVVGLYVGGFFSPLYSQKSIFLFLIALSAFAVALLSRGENARSVPAEALIAISAVLYSAEIMSYPLFGMTWNHIVNISPILIFSLIMVIFYLQVRLPQAAKMLVSSLTLVSLLAAAYSMKFFTHSKKEYEIELGKYSRERWPIKQNEILTQIPFGPFKRSMDLVDKYAPGKPMAMISRFDNLIPILMGRGLSLPGNEMMAFLFSEAEFSKVVSAIRNEKPEYLFTDNDILDPGIDELIDENVPVLGYLHIESRMRLERVNRLKVLFAQVHEGYKKIDQGGLLTVWRRL